MKLSKSWLLSQWRQSVRLVSLLTSCGVHLNEVQVGINRQCHCRGCSFISLPAASHVTLLPWMHNSSSHARDTLMQSHTVFQTDPRLPIVVFNLYLLIIFHVDPRTLDVILPLPIPSRLGAERRFGSLSSFRLG